MNRSIEWDVAVIVGAEAKKYRTVPEHWVHGADEGESYCLKCCERVVTRIRKERSDESDDVCVDGGWRTENDGMRFCCNEKCSRPLDVSFTDYAVESELEHFEANGFNAQDPGDWWSLDRMLMTERWKGGKHSARVRRLAFKAIRQVPMATRRRRVTISNRRSERRAA